MSEGMREFLAYHRRMLVLMAGVCLAAAVVLLAVFRDDWSWAGGFAVGAAAQLVKFGLLDLAAIKRIAAIREGAAVTQLKSSFMSLVLFGCAVAVVYHLRLNVWAMAAGIFLPRLVLLGDAYLRPNPFGENGGAGTELATEDAKDA